MDLSLLQLFISGTFCVMMPAMLLAQIDMPRACPGGPADTRTVQVSTPLNQSIGTLAPRIDFVLDSLGYKLARRDTVDGIWVSTPSYQWPLGSEDEDWHGKDSPGVVVAVFVSEDSTGQSLAVAGKVLCNLKDQASATAPGSVESVLEMLATIQVMSSLSPALKKPDQ